MEVIPTCIIFIPFNNVVLFLFPIFGGEVHHVVLDGMHVFFQVFYFLFQVEELACIYIVSEFGGIGWRVVGAA